MKTKTKAFFPPEANPDDLLEVSLVIMSDMNVQKGGNFFLNFWGWFHPPKK